MAWVGDAVSLAQRALRTHSGDLTPIPRVSCCHGLPDGSGILLLPEQEAGVLTQRDPPFAL